MLLQLLEIFFNMFPGDYTLTTQQNHITMKSSSQVLYHMAPIPVNLTYKCQVMSAGQRKATFGIFIAKKKLPHNS